MMRGEASAKEGRAVIRSPILPGFHADPCICRRGEDYFLAVSSFEWFPGVPVYHSRDLRHWELYANALTDARTLDLRKLPSAKGVWAPCLTYCAADGLFYLVYGVMNSMNARYFDVDNFLITAPDPKGPWSEPVYLHSSGFDASLFHDDDGRKYLVALEWETRDGHEKPGPICLVEYDPAAKRIAGLPRRIWRGGTKRGCIEAPHLTKRGEFYYLMCAEGGTGYYHSATVARSRSVWGPYEGDPENPILTSNAIEADERADTDHLKPRYFNPEVKLQKAGHASYVDAPNGETWLVCHVSRPFLPELRCTLGRETAIQRMEWMPDGWLRLADGGKLVREFVEAGDLSDCPLPEPLTFDDFDAPTLAPCYYAPRIDPASFADLSSRPGWLRLRGQESGCSQNRASILARKLTSVRATATTKLEFEPLCYQHSAGLILYYDNMNFLYLHETYSEELASPALAVLQVENGVRREFSESVTPVKPSEALWLRVSIEGRATRFLWSKDGEAYREIGPTFDTSKLSDEYSDYGEFTGTFVGLACADRLTHSRTADFDFFDYRADEGADVE